MGGEIGLYHLVGGDFSRAPVHLFVVLEKDVLLLKVGDLDIILLFGGHAHGVGEHFADIRDVVLPEGEGLGEGGGGEYGGVVPLLVFFEEFRRLVQVGELLFQQRLPYLFDAGVLFVQSATVIEIALGVFVFQKSREPGAPRVHQAPVLRDVLFLDHGDLEEELLALFGGIGVAHVHIKVHGLLFRGGDYRGVETGDGIRLFEVAGAAHVVFGEAVFRDGGTSRGYLGAFRHEIRSVYVHVVHEHIGKAVQMVEVLKEGKVQRHLDVRILLATGEVGGEFHGELLISYRGLQHGLVHGFEGAELFLLLLFHPAQEGYLAAQIVASAVAGELMGKPVRLKFRAVHQDDAQFCVRIRLELVIGLDEKLFPALEGVAYGLCFLFEWIE